MSEVAVDSHRKVCESASSALSAVLFDGMAIMAGGFGGCGVPDLCIQEIRRQQVRDVTVISNNCGGELPDAAGEGFGLWSLLKDGLVRKAISSYIGNNKLFEALYLKGELELELVPQGTLAERIRAGGTGIPAFFARAGVGTIAAEGKEIRELNGQQYLLETALIADLAVVKAWKGDSEGNLIYRKTARNFNPDMASAARFTVAEVETLVGDGQLNADCIHTPGIFVDRIFEGSAPKVIERRVIGQQRKLV